MARTHNPGWGSNRGKGAGIAFLRAHVSHAGEGCLIWPLSCDNHGYAVCGFEGKRHKAYRLMCEMVHGPAPTPKHQAAHSCGKGQEGCVHPLHLSWKTPKENMADSVRLGAVNKPGHKLRKLTEDDIAKIMALKGVVSYSVIGPMFGVRPKQIGKIHRGEQWRGGKAGQPGFKPGDPRNIGWRKTNAAKVT